MRILVISSAYSPPSNGQAMFTHNLVEQLAKGGHDVAAIFPSDQGGSYHTKRDRVDIQYLWAIDINFLYHGAVYTPFPASMIERVMRRFKPEIVHIQDHYPLCYYTLSIARRYNAKMVGTNHFMPENLAPIVPWISRYKRFFDKVLWFWMLHLYNHLDIAVGPSQTAVDIIKMRGIRVPAYPVTCGVNLERFFPDTRVDRNLWRERYGLARDKIIFFFVGRVDGEKRLDVVIRALKNLQRDDIQLVIAGTGAYLSKLSDLADSLGLNDAVRFTGYIPNDHLPALLNSIDIFTMPSEAELLSIATLEAMASARPVLLANAQALPELATNGENGYLFQAGNVEDAARCMALLADQPEKWKDMGQASYQRAQLHSLERMREGYEEVYRMALEKP